jgi:signal transduction histidine kinase
MRKVPFTVSARTARLIGRENVANAEGALIELVKNCYDADSTYSIVLIDKKDNTILILDNGHGMDDKIIQDQWMTIGTDDKFHNAITESGRIKAGAKGIGRFALDRLGDKCTMITFPKNGSRGYLWEVDWAGFDKKKNGRNVKIDEVYATLNELNNSSYNEQLRSTITNKDVLAQIKPSIFKNGTFLKIENLRDKWDGDSIKKIFENLELLTPPDGSNKIKIFLFDGSKPGSLGLVPNEEFTDYDYKVIATYKKNPKEIVELQIHRNEFDLSLIDDALFEYEDMKVFPFDKKTFKKERFNLKLPFTQLIKGYDNNKSLGDTIGDFQFTFYFLKNSFTKEDREKFNYKEFRSDRSAWLAKFGGIKMYRDNFRVRPYGEIDTQGYDWLQLGERHGQNPAAVSRKGSRVRSNQVAGVVTFSRLTNLYLEDKSSREGLQENETFELFKNLLIGIIKVQEDDRSTIGYNLNLLAATLNENENAIRQSNEIAEEEEEVDENEDPQVTKAKNRALRRGFLAQAEKLKDKEDELATSRAMASAGIMIASFSHEFNGIRNDLTSRVPELRRSVEGVIDLNKLKKVPLRKNPLKKLDEFQIVDDKIHQWITFSVELTKKDRRKNKKVDLKEYFDNFSKLWERLFLERDVKFEVKYNKNDKLNVKISELDLDCIFDNLITNSIEAFQRVGFKGQRIILIKLENISNKLSIIYTDSGPGIPVGYKKVNDIFNPFETSKKDDIGNDIGTGLGMWLVKSSVDSNNGTVKLLRPKNGFEIHIELKGLK